MKYYDRYQRELDALERGDGQYSWDELEELFSEDFQDGKLSSQEHDTLMRRLMEIDCE